MHQRPNPRHHALEHLVLHRRMGLILQCGIQLAYRLLEIREDAVGSFVVPWLGDAFIVARRAGSMGCPIGLFAT